MCGALALGEGIRLPELRNIGARGSGRGGGNDWIGLLLVWELYIDEGRESLNRPTVLCVVEEILVAALELRIPLDDIKLLALALLRSGPGGTAVMTVRGGIESVGSPRLSVESHVASACRLEEYWNMARLLKPGSKRALPNKDELS